MDEVDKVTGHMNRVEPIDDGSSNDEITVHSCGAKLPQKALFCPVCGEHIDGQHNQEEGDETIRLPVPSPALVRYSSTSRSVNNINLSKQNARGSTPLKDKIPTTPLSEIDTQEQETIQPTPSLRRQIFQRRSRPGAGTKTPSKSWGLLPEFSVICAIGVFLVALAYEGGRLSIPSASILFWIGLLLIVLPVVIRLFSSKPTRRERIALLIVLSLSLYLVTYLEYPLYFTGFDDFSHLRTAQDIIASGHLFQANPLLPISPYYPGMEIFTTALSSLTGISLFASGTLLIGVADLIFVLALYLFFEHFTDSSRMAGIAAALYMANPGYLFFDMNFAYESLALPLAVFVLFAVARRSKAPTSQRLGLNVVILLGLGAVVVTHHLTSFFLVAFLILWTLILLILSAIAFVRRNRNHRRPHRPQSWLGCNRWSGDSIHLVNIHQGPGNRLFVAASSEHSTANHADTGKQKRSPATVPQYFRLRRSTLGTTALICFRSFDLNWAGIWTLQSLAVSPRKCRHPDISCCSNWLSCEPGFPLDACRSGVWQPGNRICFPGGRFHSGALRCEILVFSYSQTGDGLSSSWAR